MAKKKGNEGDSQPNTDDINVFINKLFNEMIDQNGVDAKSGPYRFDIKLDQNGITISPSQAPVQMQSLKPMEREPLIDIIEKKGEVVVIAEIIGADKKTIELHSDSERVSIKANVGSQGYEKLIALPTKVDPLGATAVYNNGILEISLKKSNAYKGVRKIDIR